MALLLLTGARKSELLKAKWTDIDIDKRTWTLNMTKNGRRRHIPLTQGAMAVISQLPKYPWLLANPQTMLPFKDIKRSWMQARKAAGINDVHLHELRHSFASNLVNGGVDILRVSRLMGHVNLASTSRYSHLAADQLLAASEAGSAHMNVDWSQSM